MTRFGQKPPLVSGCFVAARSTAFRPATHVEGEVARAARVAREAGACGNGPMALFDIGPTRRSRFGQALARNSFTPRPSLRRSKARRVTPSA